MNPAEKLKMLDKLEGLKSRRWDLVIQLNEVNAQLSQLHGKSKVKTIDRLDKYRSRSFLISRKYEVENELIRTKREISTISETVRRWKGM